MLRLPPRLPTCVMGSKVKLWCPPTAPRMGTRRVMRKETLDTSSSDEAEHDEPGSGQWSCDMWAELLADGRLDLYCHPRHHLPAYSLRPLEVSIIAQESHPASARRRGRPRLEQELEVRVALPPEARASSSSACVYLRTVDRPCQQWASAWQGLDGALRAGEPFGGLPAARRTLVVRATPLRIRCMLRDGRATLSGPFVPQIKARCCDVQLELDSAQRKLHCSAKDALVESHGGPQVKAGPLLAACRRSPEGQGEPAEAPREPPVSVGSAQGGQGRVAVSKEERAMGWEEMQPSSAAAEAPLLCLSFSLAAGGELNNMI